MSFDVDVHDATPVRMSVVVEAADLLSPTIAFDAVVRNLAGGGIDALGLRLEAAAFDAVGSVTRAFGGSTDVEASATIVNLRFAPPEFVDLGLGDVFGGAGKPDWTLAAPGLAVGDTFSLLVAPARVDAPATWTLAALAPLPALPPAPLNTATHACARGCGAHRGAAAAARSAAVWMRGGLW